MRYNETAQVLLPLAQVPDGAVIARHTLDPRGVPMLAGKGSPRLVENHAIVTPDGAVFGPDAYPVDGRVLVVGTKYKAKVIGPVADKVKRPKPSGSNDSAERADRDATCGAIKRNGDVCTAKATQANGRCVGHRGQVAAPATLDRVGVPQPNATELLGTLTTLDPMAYAPLDRIRLARAMAAQVRNLLA